MHISKNNILSPLLIALIIIGLVFAVLGVSFTNWGFKTDDWANILHSQLSSWNNVKDLFTEGNMERFNHPSNLTVDKGSFLQGLYRPMSFIYYYPQTLLFGTKAYGYFLVTVGLHALNTGLFFLILTNFFSIAASFLAALFFGFHPSLQNWLGWISAQTYFIELLFLGFIFISFYRWLQTHQTKWYLLSVVFFFINLLLKEATIILPAWIFLATLLYQSEKLTFQKCRLAIKNSIGFIIASTSYCCIRIFCMPFNTSNTTTLGFNLSWQSFVMKQITRAMQFLTYLYDILGLTWLPKGNRIFNGFVLFSILGILTIFFIKSSRKKLILFCIASTLIFSWPGLLMHYQPRYIYMALPWVIVTLIVLIQSISIKKQPFKNLFYIGSLGFIVASSFYIFTNMKKREFALHWLDNSMRNLVEKDLPRAGWKQEPLYFLGLPSHWFDMGTAQAVWFLDKKQTNTYPIYQSGPSLYMPNQDHPWAVPHTNSTTISTTLHQEGDGGIIKLSNNHEFRIRLAADKDLQATFLIPLRFRNKGLWLITWDYIHAKFKILSYLPPA